MYPQVDQQEAMRRRMLQQQQMGFGQGVIPAAQAQPMYGQNVTQPLPSTNPWQQRVPQNFNQGAMYDQFTRRW